MFNYKRYNRRENLEIGIPTLPTQGFRVLYKTSKKSYNDQGT